MSFRRSHRSLIGTHKSEIGTADDMELAPPLAISVETSTLKRVDTYTKDTSDTKWDGKA
ncbi:hypothetical protein PUNSTDRAFT_137668 [Punctularia strigosozonata HHB-11173 SS5]|uniref:uncharacterized protein n=1 Tax=Punctularia strigosozonata (strain HHB-11173) TaxID=741275 RepID=UPI00044171B3|nr:uncharacterized protein PUNSTDRAFT_137668 [Punctularia strigosozonata HHB-11173 SS5]EIN05561.1 hypothetical protein PUNSTDRAFT_137668 [Punctularia strigosozonata HHB-11173 SS5]